MGAFVLAAFANPSAFQGKDMKIVADWVTVRDMARQAAEITGLDVRCLEGSMDDFERSQYDPWSGARDLYLMNLYYIQVYLNSVQLLIIASQG